MLYFVATDFCDMPVDIDLISSLNSPYVGTVSVWQRVVENKPSNFILSELKKCCMYMQVHFKKIEIVSSYIEKAIFGSSGTHFQNQERILRHYNRK